MIVGVPKEVKADEYRVAITPAGVRELTAAGHTVYVEKEAGVGSSIPDADFIATGAQIMDDPDDIWSTSDMILGVKEPIAVEYPRLGMKKDQVLFTYLHLAAGRACTEALVAAGNTAIAYETVRLSDNSLPLLTPMSEVAGRMAPLMGAHHLMRPGGEVILMAGQDHSINPRLLTALLDYESGWVTDPNPQGDALLYPMGYVHPYLRELSAQLNWTTTQLAVGYYGWRAGTLTELKFPDGSTLRINPALNAGTVALQYFFAQSLNRPAWDKAVGDQGFAATYRRLFGDPKAQGVQDVLAYASSLEATDQALVARHVVDLMSKITAR